MLGKTNSAYRVEEHVVQLARIVCTYPSNATISCKDSSNNVINPVTTGVPITYDIYTADTYTLTITRGSSTASRAVQIKPIDEGSTISVVLSFALYIVQDGAPVYAFTPNGFTLSQTDGYYYFNATKTNNGYQTACYVRTTDAITVGTNTKLCLDGNLSGGNMLIWNSSDTSWTTSTADATVAINTNTNGHLELTIPSGLTSIRVGFHGVTGTKIYALNMYLAEV